MPQVKVDFTAINRPFENEYLTLINFSVDAQHLNDQQSAVACSQIIANFLLEYFQQEVYIGVQICASYNLRHSETNDVRLFTGSFNNTPNMMNSLSGDHFFPFRINTWPQLFLQFSDLDRAYNILHPQPEVDTKWEVESIESIIVNCQLVLPTYHPFLTEYQLNQALADQQHGRRRRRKHKTIILH